jgi:hypothetical protein
LLVGTIKITFGKAQVVYGIQQIGFAYPIVAYYAVNLFIKA